MSRNGAIGSLAYRGFLQKRGGPYRFPNNRVLPTVPKSPGDPQTDFNEIKSARAVLDEIATFDAVQDRIAADAAVLCLARRLILSRGGNKRQRRGTGITQ